MTENTPGKTWFITGTSRGFGREWAIAALERGDRVAATARDTGSLDDLVEQYGDAILPLAARRHRPRGRLRRRRSRRTSTSAASTSSSTTPATATSASSRSSPRRRPAPRWRPTCSARCGSRRRRCRSCASRAPATSSRCRRSAASRAFPLVGVYHASKWALEGFSQALAQEVAGFGIHVTLIEPGGFSHRLGRLVVQALRAELPGVRRAARAGRRGRARRASARPATRRPPPPPSSRSSTPTSRRCASFFGTAPLGIAKADYASRLETWEQWQHVAELAQG